MSRLAHQAELLKLARLLDVDTAELEMLDSVSAPAVHQLRLLAEQASQNRDAALFRRLVSASRLLPIPALALIAENVLGPLLVAKVAGQMDVQRGVGIAGRLDTEFLADVCLRLDPRQSAPLIRAIPKRQILAVAQELTRRDEHITMGRFVDILSDEAIQAVVSELDDEDLLRCAFFAENKRRLDEIVGLLSEERLVAIIRCAASDADLWPEALGLMQHLSAPVRGRLADLAAGLESEVLTSMVHSIRIHELWSDALPIVVGMREESQARFANLPAVQDTKVLNELIGAASRDAMLHHVLPLVVLMDDRGKSRTARVAETLDGEQLLAVADAAAQSDSWPSLIELMQRMDELPRRETTALVGMAPERSLEGFLQALNAGNASSLLEDAWPWMGLRARARVLKVSVELSLDWPFAHGSVDPASPDALGVLVDDLRNRLRHLEALLKDA